MSGLFDVSSFCGVGGVFFESLRPQTSPHFSLHERGNFGLVGYAWAYKLKIWPLGGPPGDLIISGVQLFTRGEKRA